MSPHKVKDNKDKDKGKAEIKGQISCHKIFPDKVKDKDKTKVKHKEKGKRQVFWPQKCSQIKMMMIMIC